MKKRLLSGVKPTGRPHIGNYFGAMKQFVDNQNEFDSYIMLADYHTLNHIQDRDSMRQLSIDTIIDYLAIGLDPKNVTIFAQSAVPAHTELAWIFDSITTMPYLQRAHAYKDAMAKNKEVSVGTFNYPMLMAADILLYSPEIVPVGRDQKQHVEITRDTAQKFNHIFDREDETPTFNLPKELILDEVAIVPGIDGQKMSKSYKNTIPLFASDEEIEKQVMAIVTDSSGDEPVNVKAIHSLLKPAAEIEALYTEHKGKYKALKEALITDLKTFITPLREKREQIAKDMEFIHTVLKEGNAKAKEVAETKMKMVRDRVGVTHSDTDK